MPKILNIFFSSRKDHAAAIYLHSEISRYLSSRNYDVTNLCLSGTVEDWPSHLPVPRVFFGCDRKVVKGKKSILYFFLKRQLLSFIKQGEYEAIICDGLGVLNLLSHIFFINLPPVISVLHAPPRISAKPDSKLRQLLMPKKNALVAISPTVRNRFTTAGYGEENKILMIPNAINFEALQTQQLVKKQSRRIFGLTHDEFVIGIIGRLVSYKQQKILIDAAVNLLIQKRLPDTWRFLIIGDGSEMNNLKAFTSHNQLDNHVIFTGQKDNAAQYVKAMDLFVMTSNEEEGFGLVILEAMAGRVPVIANATPVFRDLVVDEQCRFELNSANDLSRKLLAFYKKTNEEREEIANRQYQRATEYFGISRFHKAYEALILEKMQI